MQKKSSIAYTFISLFPIIRQYIKNKNVIKIKTNIGINRYKT